MQGDPCTAVASSCESRPSNDLISDIFVQAPPITTSTFQPKPQYQFFSAILAVAASEGIFGLNSPTAGASVAAGANLPVSSVNTDFIDYSAVVARCSISTTCGGSAIASTQDFGFDANGFSKTLAVPPSLAAGTYYVFCSVVGGSASGARSPSVSITVTAPPQPADPCASLSGSGKLRLYCCMPLAPSAAV